MQPEGLLLVHLSPVTGSQLVTVNVFPSSLSLSTLKMEATVPLKRRL
jgi:hypothetical protein